MRSAERPPFAARSAAQAQQGGVIRNLLLDLHDSPQRWKRFVEELEAIFPDIHLQRPEFDEQVDRYIHVGYTEGLETSTDKRRKTPELDIFSGGSGFHQFVQILAAILVEDATTVLLDEPDAHLFSRLQADLFAVMGRLVDSGIQIIAATHSTEWSPHVSRTTDQFRQRRAAAPTAPVAGGSQHGLRRWVAWKTWPSC